MKLFVLFLLLTSLLPSSSGREIEWEEKKITLGDFKTLHLRMDLEGPCSVKICDSVYLGNAQILDSLFDFLSKHITAEVIIESHIDYGPNNLYSSVLSEEFARDTRQYCISRGIDSVRISAIGYGNTMQLIQEDSIVKAPKREQWKLRYQNTRMLMRIKNI